MNALERLKATNAQKQDPSQPTAMDATKAVEQVAATLPDPTPSTAADHRAAMLARLKGGQSTNPEIENLKGGLVNPPEWQPPPANAEERDNPTDLLALQGTPDHATAITSKRHRRTKAEMEAARAQEQATVPATLSVGPVSNEPVTLIVDTPSDRAPIRAQVTTTIGIPTSVDLVTDMPIPYLFVDCIPSGLEVENLANVIAIASGLICKAQKVGDYRYIEFGKGTAMLVESMVHIVKTNPGRNYALDSHTPEGSALLNPLSALSAIVIRGIR
jgi:hypothetical protein